MVLATVSLAFRSLIKFVSPDIYKDSTAKVAIHNQQVYIYEKAILQFINVSRSLHDNVATNLIKVM